MIKTCIGCRRCCDFCPKALDIPGILARREPLLDGTLSADTLPRQLQPSSCVGCGMCRRVCPQDLHAGRIFLELSAALRQKSEAHH